MLDSMDIKIFLVRYHCEDVHKKEDVPLSQLFSSLLHECLSYISSSCDWISILVSDISSLTSSFSLATRSVCRRTWVGSSNSKKEKRSGGCRALHVTLYTIKHTKSIIRWHTASKPDTACFKAIYRSLETPDICIFKTCDSDLHTFCICKPGSVNRRCERFRDRKE